MNLLNAMLALLVKQILLQQHAASYPESKPIERKILRQRGKRLRHVKEEQ